MINTPSDFPFSLRVGPRGEGALASRGSFAVKLGLLLALSLGSNTVMAQPIVVVDDVSPDTPTNPTWHVGGALTVGDTTTGSLSITTGGYVTNTTGTLGGTGTGEGTVDVLGGTWANSSFLRIGQSGVGTLNLSSGTISNSSVSVGANIGSSGVINVSGGSWTNSSFFYLGGSGNGSLNLTGGTITSADAFVGQGSGTGVAIIDGGNLDQLRSIEGWRCGHQ